eukprot:g14117.t1
MCKHWSFASYTCTWSCVGKKKNRMSDNEPEEQHEEPDNKQAEEKKVPDPAVEEVIEGVNNVAIQHPDWNVPRGDR